MIKPDVIIHKVNESFVRLETSQAIESHVFHSFRFTNNKLRYHPKVKARLWDGYINLFNIRSKLIYLGLIEDLVFFFKENEYTYSFSFSKENNFNADLLQDTYSLIDDNFELFDHQKQAIEFALKANRGIIISATGSGKSLIMYTLAMYYLLNNSKKILIIVPRTQLVKQLANAFMEYHKGDKEEFGKSFELIYSGTDKNPDSSIVFSTWQSLHQNPKEFFEDYDVVMFDEAHMAKAKCLTSIMEKCENTKFKFGFTGTLSNENEESEIDELVLKGLFGKVETVSTNKELMDKNILTEALIYLIRLKYTDKQVCNKIMNGDKEIKDIKDYKTKRKKLFDAENEYIINSDERNKYLLELALSRRGNTLVMFQFVEKQGKLIYNLLKNVSEKYGKDVYYVHGNVSVNERERIRQLVEERDNLIVVRSYGTTSTGLDFKNIHHIIFASAFKSRITMKQTIGRGLRKHKTKDKLYVYDLGDDFSLERKTKNFLFSHFLERVKMYKDEKFKLKLVDVELL
jgi:superfamily II DNA or RNA helicase